MNPFLINLQLSQPEDSYPNLMAYLKSANKWARPVTNAWIIRTPKTAAEIRDGITERINIKLGDKVIVMRLPDNFHTDWATNNISKAVTDWLKRGGQ